MEIQAACVRPFQRSAGENTVFKMQHSRGSPRLGKRRLDRTPFPPPAPVANTQQTNSNNKQISSIPTPTNLCELGREGGSQPGRLVLSDPRRPPRRRLRSLRPLREAGHLFPRGLALLGALLLEPFQSAPPPLAPLLELGFLPTKKQATFTIQNAVVNACGKLRQTFPAVLM